MRSLYRKLSLFATTTAPPRSLIRAHLRTLSTMSSSSSSSPPVSSPLSQPVKIACVQLASGADKAANLAHARAKVLEAAQLGAQIVVLPECFNSPYGTNFFPQYAEEVPAVGTAADAAVDGAAMPSFVALRDMARDAGVFLVGGSIPEREAASGKLYNTALVFSPAGGFLAAHRKVHLFDISIPGQITFRESDVLTAGAHATVVDMAPFGRVSVAICYDIRFPALAAVAARHGCFAYIVPGAFNMTTGPLHWRLLAQARAVDNQMYAVLCSPARDVTAGYHAWGHSLVVDPMAKVLLEADEKEDIVVAELVPSEIERARSGIPVGTQRRFDVYGDVMEGAKVVIS